MSDNNGSYDFLPVEIANDILLRLPTKSLITCICVCKTWKSLIQNPTFISTHLHLSINNNNNHHLLFGFGSWPQESYALHNDDDDDCTQHTRFDFPLLVPELGPLNGYLSLVGTCNGLICFFNELSSYEIDTFFLWNPCVRRFVILPSPNVTLRTHGELVRFIGFGFGFDAKTKDYKVVRLVTYWDNPNIPSDRPVVEVYSLATWRMENGCCFASHMRTGAYDAHYFILAFDLGDEVFREILLPEELSYTRLLCFREVFIPLPRGFRRNGEVVLIVDDEGKHVSMDLENQKMKDLMLDSSVSYFIDSYVESLLLLDKPANVAVTY
uniref:F-box domain-containing protein n=1 Tax=Fagus sylvatica TaxID=28930 RepID=A0A2N9HXQ6_FAGSY